MSEKLHRLRHVLLLIVALVIPSFSILLSFSIKPMINVAYATTFSWQYLYNLLGIQFFYLGWIILQREALFPSEFQFYLKTLPVNPFKERLLDIIMLAIANNIFLTPLILSILFIFNTPQISNTGLAFLNMVILTASILLLQLTWTHQKKAAIINLIIINLLLFISLYAKNFSFVFSIINLIFIVYIAINPSTTYKQYTTFPKKNHSMPKLRLINPISYNLPMINFIILWRKFRFNLILRSFASLTIMILTKYLIDNNKALDPLFLTFLLFSFILLIISGLYPTLSNARAPYILYIRTLSLSKAYWLFCDWFSITTITFFFYLCFTIMSIHEVHVLQVLKIIAMLLPASILLCPLRNKLRTQGTVLSILMLICWTFIFIKIRYP